MRTLQYTVNTIDCAAVVTLVYINVNNINVVHGLKTNRINIYMWKGLNQILHPSTISSSKDTAYIGIGILSLAQNYNFFTMVINYVSAVSKHVSQDSSTLV